GLEAAYGRIGFRSEDAVDRQSLRRVAGEVAELELLLHATHGVALRALPDLDDQRTPGLRADDAVHPEALVVLERADRAVGLRPEVAVDRHRFAARPQQVLQGRYRMFLGALADLGPRAQCACHANRLLPLRHTARRAPNHHYCPRSTGRDGPCGCRRPRPRARWPPPAPGRT